MVMVRWAEHLVIPVTLQVHFTIQVHDTLQVNNIQIRMALSKSTYLQQGR